MRYRLRTLLILLALGPPLLAFAIVNRHPGPSLAIGLLLVWSYEIAAGVAANFKRNP
jgi:hypothetical protein